MVDQEVDKGNDLHHYIILRTNNARGESRIEKIAQKVLHAAMSIFELYDTKSVIEAPEKSSFPHTFDHCSHLGSQEPLTSVRIVIRVPTQNSKILSGLHQRNSKIFLQICLDTHESEEGPGFFEYGCKML